MQLLTGANKILILPAIGKEAIADGGNTRDLTILYVPDHPMLLSVPYEFGSVDSMNVWQGAETAQAYGGDQAIREEDGLASGRIVIEHPQD